MQSLSDLNKLAELLLMLKYHGFSRGDGIDGVSQIPGKDAHNEGLSVKHSGAGLILDEMDLDIKWLVRKSVRNLNRLLRRERGG